MAGMSLGIHLPQAEITDPMDVRVVVVPNIKRSVWKEETAELAEKLLKELGVKREFRSWKELQNFVEESLRKRGEMLAAMPKPNGLGFPAGMIESWDKPDDEARLVEAGIIQEFESGRKVLWHKCYDLESGTSYPPGTPEFTFAREWVEETETCAWESWEEKASPVNILHIVPHFARLCTLLSRDRETGELTYRSHFYLVKSIFGELGTTGVRGETKAPKIENIFTLTNRQGPNHAYLKHMQGLITLLRRYVQGGELQYKEALNYLAREFPAEIFEESLKREHEIENLSSDLSDEELWEKQISKLGVTPIKNR